jgi:hypothetical protein
MRKVALSMLSPAAFAKYVTIASRFWSKVDKNGPIHQILNTQCWLWTASKHRQGYGTFHLDKKCVKAHRVAWFLTYGRWPRFNLLHRCDNTACVRPSHLQEGTQKDNMQDAASKGRLRHKGEANGNSKLTERLAARIRSGHSKGSCTLRELASKFGISCSQVFRIVHGKAWV